MSCCYLVCFTHTIKGGQSYGSRTITFSAPITGQAGIDLLHEKLAAHLKVKAVAVLSLTRLDAPEADALADVAARAVPEFATELRNVISTLETALEDPGCFDRAMDDANTGLINAKLAHSRWLQRK